jgi:hypothetical protein
MTIERDCEEGKRESGLPGGGAGRREVVRGSGVYPMSGPHPAGDAPVIPEPEWGQEKLGRAGCEESGRSELWFSESKPEQCRDIMTKRPHLLFGVGRPWNNRPSDAGWRHRLRPDRGKP